MKKVPLFTVLLVILLSIVISSALANGTETLGPPSIGIASGSGVVAAGVGLEDQPGTIDINVPGAVVQALLYWGGAVTQNALSDDTVLVNGASVTGSPIGGQAYFFSAFGKEFYYSNYRADITGRVVSGANSFEIDELDNKDVDGNGENSGAGILVIYDDGSGTADIQVRDGLDLAFFGFPDPRQSTVPQTFIVAASSSDRIADLFVFAGSVGGGRPNEIKITVGAASTTLVDPLSSSDGDLWDTLVVPVTIPADETSVTVELISPVTFDPNGASMNWIGAGLSVPVPPPGGEGCTPGFWRNHLEDWGPTGLNPADDFDTTFGVDYFDPDITLDEAVNAKGGGVKKLARHGTAALLNALHPAVNYPLTAAEVIALVQDNDIGNLVESNELLTPGFCE